MGRLASGPRFAIAIQTHRDTSHSERHQDPFHSHSCRPGPGPTHVRTQHNASQRLQLTLESRGVSADQGDMAPFGERLKSRMERRREKNEHDLRCHVCLPPRSASARAAVGGAKGKPQTGRICNHSSVKALFARNP